MFRFLAIVLLTLPGAVMANNSPRCADGEADCKPWERDWIVAPPPGVMWRNELSNGDVYQVSEGNIDYENNGNVLVWLEIDHSRNAAVKQRSTLGRLIFDCRGNYRITAATTYDAGGQVLEDWDGFPRQKAVRPGTVFANLQQHLCTPAN